MILRHLDLFSGIGGFALAAEWVGGIKTDQFVEIDRYAQAVLSVNFPKIPIHDNIATFFGASGQYDLITAGFPCQDISSANPAGKGLDGDRSGLFFEACRIIREVGPRYLLLENVPNLLQSNGSRDMGAVLYELAQLGYDAEWQVLSAAGVGANHLRRRLWIIAYANSQRRKIRQQNEPVPNSERNLSAQEQGRDYLKRSSTAGFDAPFPPRLSGISNIARMDDGLSARLGNKGIGLLGNAIVPAVAVIPLQRILDLERAAA
jgi:DNA (cytosine-5)-methyltransferase 1